MTNILTDPNAWYDQLVAPRVCAICGRPENEHSQFGDNCPGRKGRTQFAYKHFGDRVEDDMERSRR
jgi:hypothetical protein